MTVFNPDQHFMLFLTSLNGVVDYNTFQDKAKGIWAKDVFMASMNSAGLLDTEISDTAPSSTEVIWVDPNNPSTTAPSVIRIYNTASAAWETATLALFADLLARVGGYSSASAWTAANRPGTPSVGQAGYNQTSGAFEYWNGSAWVTIGAGGSSLPSSGVGTLYRDSSGNLSYASKTWTTAGRPGSPYVGQAGYNSTLNAYEFWDNTAWVQFASGGDTHYSQATVPTTPVVGDTWYDTTIDVLFQRVNDGVANIWLQIS